MRRVLMREKQSMTGTVPNATAPKPSGTFMRLIYAVRKMPQSYEALIGVVRNGKMVSEGMPEFAELDDEQIANLRQYIRTKAHELLEHTEQNVPTSGAQRF